MDDYERDVVGLTAKATRVVLDLIIAQMERDGDLSPELWPVCDGIYSDLVRMVNHGGDDVFKDCWQLTELMESKIFTKDISER